MINLLSYIDVSFEPEKSKNVPSTLITIRQNICTNMYYSTRVFAMRYTSNYIIYPYSTYLHKTFNHTTFGLLRPIQYYIF